jgi:hypothetical protein
MDTQLQQLHIQHLIWHVYITRALFILFMISWGIEVARLGADDYATYLTAYHNPPDHCFYELKKEKSWFSFSWFNFDAPIKTDCVEFFRRTNQMVLYLPRFPQALSNVITHIFISPLVVFLDLFGNALRHFMDKFNFGERVLGILFLFSFFICGTFLFAYLCTARTQVLIPESDVKRLKNGP